MPKLWKAAVIFALVGVATGCSTIPPAAVELSVQVGQGIRGQHAALLKSVDTYFLLRSQQLDKGFADALDTYFEELTRGAPLNLDKKQLSDIAKDVLDLAQKHNETKEELDATRALLEQKAADDYLVLVQANATVTALLQSAVDMDKATSGAIAKVTEATKGEVDLQKALERMDALLLQSGKAAGGTVRIYEEIKKLLGSAKGGGS